MRRTILTNSLLVFALFAILCLPAQAQDERIEFELGVNYPLIGESFEIDQNPAFHAKFRVRLSQRFWIGGVYDVMSSEGEVESLKFQYVDEVPCFDPQNPFTAGECSVRDGIKGGDVDITLYGLTSTLVLFGEPDMQIYLTGGVGVGEVDYTNPQADGSGLPLRPDEDFDGTADGVYTFEDRADKTDIDLWYEFGGGIRFALGSGRFGLRLQAVYRRMSPDGKNTVLPVGVSEIVPSAGFTVRF